MQDRHQDNPVRPTVSGSHAGTDAVEGTQSDYWESGAWLDHATSPVWRLHADWVHARLLTRWIDFCQRPEDAAVLKTDLYEEAVGTGQVPWLLDRFRTVSGIDISGDVVAEATRRNGSLEGTTADTRKLPFEDESFDVVVSLSTLDHFSNVDDIHCSLAEIARVLAPGGILILTLDNTANPIVWIRQALPRRMIDRTKLVPYYCGATLGPIALSAAVQGTGLEVIDRTAIMHCPRVLAVPFARFLDRRLRAREGFLRVLRGFETLERLPSRYLTGHFTAVLCRKPG